MSVSSLGSRIAKMEHRCPAGDALAAVEAERAVWAAHPDAERHYQGLFRRLLMILTGTREGDLAGVQAAINELRARLGLERIT
ncbi:MAG: hypothetical protein IVW57_14255 [Ktedonobacterales bacterium]|nr:hypothetical protein [Ktedonobacterales bacterium]